MSQMNIKFIIKGLAICYHKNDGVWKIIFPFDNDHKINFSFKKIKTVESGGDGEYGGMGMRKTVSEELVSNPIPLAVANREILIESSAAPPVKLEDNDFSEFIDLTANYSHENGVKLKGDWRERGVLMRIPNATLFMEKSTDKQFTLSPINKKLEVDLGTVGEVVGGRITLNEGGSLAVKIEDKDVIPPIAFEDGADYTLIFDNDCATENNTGKDDFEQYYKLIEDADDAGLVFDPSLKVDKTIISVMSETNPLIICGGVRVSNASDPSFP